MDRLDLAIMGVAVLLPFVGSGALRGTRRLASTAEGMRSLQEDYKLAQQEGPGEWSQTYPVNFRASIGA